MAPPCGTAPSRPDPRQDPRQAYRIRTEQAHFDWIKRSIHFHGKRHPPGVEAYLMQLDRMFDLSLVADKHQPMSAMERNALWLQVAGSGRVIWLGLLTWGPCGLVDSLHWPCATARGNMGRSVQSGLRRSSLLAAHV